MQKNKYDSLLAPKYDDMIRGINITPQQEQELKKLYGRSTLPVRPWAFIFAGGMVADLAGMMYALCDFAETGDKKIVAGYFAILLAQLIVLGACGYRMQRADKQLRNKLNEIKMQKGR